MEIIAEKNKNMQECEKIEKNVKILQMVCGMRNEIICFVIPAFCTKKIANYP